MSYRIGSFNVRNWGRTSCKDFAKIAEIITEEQLDVVAFQEVLSEGIGIKRMLEQAVKYHLYDWDFCWGSPAEPTDKTKLNDMILNDRRGEGYAYIWNKKKFRLSQTIKLGADYVFDPRIINSKSNDVKMDCSLFARTPFYMRLQPTNTGFFDLRLINIHIYFGNSTLSEIEKRKLEYKALVEEVYPALSQRRYGDFRPAYTIAMGDYNLNIFRQDRQTKEKNADLQEVVNVHGFGEVITSQEALSTLKMSEQDNSANILTEDIGANNYDHFTYKDRAFSQVKCQVINAVDKYCSGDLEYYRKNISDHLPIVVEISL